MRIEELITKLVNVNLTADVIFKTDKKSDTIEIIPDCFNVYRQKEITIVVGTKKKRIDNDNN